MKQLLALTLALITFTSASFGADPVSTATPMKLARKKDHSKDKTVVVKPRGRKSKITKK